MNNIMTLRVTRRSRQRQEKVSRLGCIHGGGIFFHFTWDIEDLL